MRRPDRTQPAKSAATGLSLPLDPSPLAAVLLPMLKAAVAEVIAEATPRAPDQPPGDRLLTLDEAAEYLRVSRSTLNEWEYTRPGFPKRIRLGPKNPVYLESELRAWAERQPRGMASG